MASGLLISQIAKNINKQKNMCKAIFG